jgi:hypothetical protein
LLSTEPPVSDRLRRRSRCFLTFRSQMRATILQALGAVAVSGGLATYNPALGLIAAGSFLIIFGVADERGK